jgi:hypothetical protein
MILTNINYKNLRRAALSASVLLFLSISACDVTDLEPLDQVSETLAFESPSLIELSVAGMYDVAQSGTYDPLNGQPLQVRGYPFGSASIQQSEMRGEDMINVAGFYAITYQNNITPASPNNVNMWSSLYALINVANAVIEGSRTAGSSAVVSAEQAEAYEAEGRFMRALAYHELLIHFARPYSDKAGENPGVPYRDYVINTPAKIDQAITQGRNTVAEVYTKILEDLAFAEESLPETRGGVQKITRATKGAAIALAQRVRLHQGNWAQTVAEGSKLISESSPLESPIGGYKLTTTPQDPFAINTSSEAIFSIENASNDNPGVNGALPNMLGSPTNGARGLVAISPRIFNAPFWECDDLRRTQLLSNDGRSYFTNKYRDPVTNTDYAPLIRYAEVLLNQAEALARSTGSVDARAVELLNAVRNRAVTDAAKQYTTASFADANALIQAILNERRIEFLAEGRRWADIHRLANDPVFTTNGIPAKVTFGTATFATYNCETKPTVAAGILAVPYTDARFLWPIPAAEIANNPTLASQQNPGW